MQGPGLREDGSHGLDQTTATACISLRIRRLGVRVPPSAPRSAATSDLGMDRLRTHVQQQVQQSLAVELLSEPAQSVTDCLIGDLGINLHGDGDLAVTQYPHRYPRMHVERRKQGGARAAHAMRCDVANPGGAAACGEVPGEVAGFVGSPMAGRDH